MSIPMISSKATNTFLKFMSGKSVGENWNIFALPDLNGPTGYIMIGTEVQLECPNDWRKASFLIKFRDNDVVFDISWTNGSIEIQSISHRISSEDDQTKFNELFTQYITKTSVKQLDEWKQLLDMRASKEE